MARKNARLPDVPTAVLPLATLLAGRAAYNPRRISDHDANELRGSLRDFGLVEPVVWNRRRSVLVGGHQRLEQLEALGVTSAEARIVDLDEAGERRLNLLLNRARGDWDWEKLGADLDWLRTNAPGLEARAGFTEEELRAIERSGNLLELEARAARDELAALEKPAPAREEDEAPPAAQSNVAAIARLGDVWRAGPHVVVCADSTRPETWPQLLAALAAAGAQPPACVLTDPPFAIYGSSSGLSADVTDDRIVRPFFVSVLRAAGELLPVFGHAYVCCDWRSWPAIWDAAKGTSVTAKNLLVWDKGGQGLGNNYANTYELVGFFHKLPKQTTMRGDAPTGQRQVLRPNLFKFPRVRGDEREHNAAKPVALFAELLANSSDEGGSVVDLFMGSGTVLLAAEQLKRRAVAVDVEPRWVDVALRRYERATGVQATLAAGGARFDDVAAARAREAGAS